MNVDVSALNAYLANHDSTECGDISVVRLCSRLRGLSHSSLKQGLFHYTTWSSLLKMLSGLPNVKGRNVKHSLLLGSCGEMNDRDDAKCGPKTCFASFSRGNSESVAMWANYGIPREEAIRLRFPLGVIASWFAGINEKLDCFSRDGSKDVGLCDVKSLFFTINFPMTTVSMSDISDIRQLGEMALNSRHRLAKRIRQFT